jgi:hypothetical protein
MEKDFLFLNYSFVKNSTFYFSEFSKMGHEIDIIDETNIKKFIPNCKYKNIVLYLHQDWTFPLTNYIIDNYGKDSFLIQHDDTDNEQLQRWSNRKPDLFMQREYTSNTIIDSYGGTIDSIGPRIQIDTTPVEPFHFPMESMYDDRYQDKKWDICFIGRPTNPRRQFFIDKVLHLSRTSLKHLNFYIKYEWVEEEDIKNRREEKAHDYYKEIINGSKIGINFPGNSYDAHRIWELASCGTPIIMPKLKIKSVDDSHMPFDEYVSINDDCSDLEEKILYMLDNDKWINYGKSIKKSYDERHNPQKCFEYYYKTVMKYAKK